MSEYSYFRAEGRAVEAINTVEESIKQIKEISHKLSAEYGALGFTLWPAGKYREKDEPSFTYKNRTEVPEGFAISRIQTDNNGITEQAAWAKPKPGTPAAFNVAGQSGLIAVLSERSILERIFGCGDMPMKDLPAGRYSRAFVRSQDYICEYGVGYMNDGKDRDDAGRIPDTTRRGADSNCPISVSDPLSFMRLDRNWYIRVPNDEKGKPRFVPPDSTPVKYDDMLQADDREHKDRHPYARLAPSAKKPSGP